MLGLEVITVATAGVPDSQPGVEKSHYSLNIEPLNCLCHRAAMVALLKLKGKALLQELPAQHNSRAEYSFCSSQAKIVVQYARCVSQLIDSRNQVDAGKLYSEQYQSHDYEARGDLLTGLQKFLNLIKPLPRFTPSIPPLTITHFKIRRHPSSSKRKKRRRRSIETAQSERESHFDNLANLQRLHRYVDMQRFTSGYISRLNNDNSKALKTLLPKEFGSVNFEVEPSKQQGPEKLDTFLNSLLTTNGKLRVLSPKLFSLQSASRKPKFLSPEILSFSSDSSDTLHSLPELVNKVLGSGDELKHEKEAWLDLLMNLTGTGPALKMMMEHLGPEMDNMDEQIFPVGFSLKWIFYYSI